MYERVFIGSLRLIKPRVAPRRDQRKWGLFFCAEPRRRLVLTPRAMNARLHDDEWPSLLNGRCASPPRVQFFRIVFFFIFYFFKEREWGGTNLEFDSNLDCFLLFQVSWTIIFWKMNFLSTL